VDQGREKERPGVTQETFSESPNFDVVESLVTDVIVEEGLQAELRLARDPVHHLRGGSSGAGAAALIERGRRLQIRGSAVRLACAAIQSTIYAPHLMVCGTCDSQFARNYLDHGAFFIKNLLTFARF
jgi:hypothetical protein